MDGVNASRYDAGAGTGFYESFFQRANHPQRPLAFWIRYTLFSPAGAPERAIGELWAIFFDGERGEHVAVKREVPWSECAFAREGFSVRVADATLGPGALDGAVRSDGGSVGWTLTFEGGEPPLYFLPLALYDRGLPKAKSLVARPLATYQGSLAVGERTVDVDGWVGSQNHNWGTRHTDSYAWGQVAGFDGAPGSFLEVATARLKLGPVWTPAMTPLVLRHDGEEYALNTIGHTLRAKGAWSFFDWSFRASGRVAGTPGGTDDRKRPRDGEAVEIQGRITAPPEAFVGLRYRNPPGGEKHCLNTKIASCELELRRPGRPPERLRTESRAAFEILTDRRDHGVPLRA